MNTGQASSCCQGRSASGSRLGRYLPTWLGGRRGLIVGALALGGGGMALGWPWLVAIGAAPVLIALLPCTIMCALGLCMRGKSNQTAASPGAKTDVAGETATPALVGRDPQPLLSGEMSPDRERAALS